MGFFSLKAVCGVCGREVGWNRFKIALDDAWCCPDCLKRAQHNGNCTVNVNKITIDGLKKLIVGGMDELKKDQEYRKKCDVCGHIFCYTDSDILRNKLLAKQARSSANMAVLEAIGGTRIASNQQSAAADRAINQIVDYNKCPKCKSTNLSDSTDADIQQAANPIPQSNISIAEELKQFKELLDMGVITQEEFDAQKKQLLSRNVSPVQAQAPRPVKSDKWKCSCGRENANYVSTCVCGVRKLDMINK